MSNIRASRSILNASANYEAEDWGSVSGSAGLDFKASAELKRGFDLELGAEALVGLDANISKFLSVDVQGHANASALVRAQVQVPLDLFDEAGLAIRLQAVAEAAAGIELGIGLDVGDFLALAGEDPRMQGLALPLLRIFLEEVQIRGAVMAKAAAAAMAYANVAVTGKLIGNGSQKAGFNVSCEAGIGLKAGAGYRVFAGFDLDDPSRMIRRTVDALVDDTLKRLADHTRDQTLLTKLDGLRAPAKMALRTSFELGAELARGSGTFNAVQGPVIAQRCLQVFFEEAQRYVIQQVADFATQTFTASLPATGFSENAWEAARPQRVALATRLRNQPTDPFDPTADNKGYWNGVVNDSIALALALGARNHHSEAWVAPLATLWSATQLLFATVSRISSGGARASVLNASANTRFPPYQGTTTQPPHALIHTFFDSLLPQGTMSRNPTLEDLVAHVTADRVLDPLIAQYPALKVVLEIVGGTGANSTDTVRTLMNNLGPFISAGAANQVDPQQSINVVLEGLRRYVNHELRNDVEPALHQLLAGSPADVRLYLDDVVISTLRFATNVIFAQASQWSAADNSIHKAMREACSALVMQLLGRTLVVTTDILFDKALQEMSGAMRAAVPQLNRRNGAVDKLANLVPALDRNVIKDTVEEIFDIAADVFSPLPRAKRARIRELLYDIIDTVPPSPDTEFLDALKNESLIPNVEAATELAMELGGLIAESFTRLIGRIIEMLGEAIFEALEAIIETIEKEIEKWVQGIKDLLEDLGKWLEDVAEEIAQLEAAVKAAADDFLDQTENFLGLLSGSKRGSLRTSILDSVYHTGRDMLWDIPGYSMLSKADRRKVKNKLYDVLDGLLDRKIFDDIAEAIGDIAGDIEDFIEDARAIDPDDDVAGELIGLLADRIEDALNDNFGSRVEIPIEFEVKFFAWTFEVELGEIKVYTSDVINVIQALVDDLTAVTSAADNLARTLTSWIRSELALDKCLSDQENWRAQQRYAQKHDGEIKAVTPSIRIIQPGASAAYAGNVQVEIALIDVPRSFLGLVEGETTRVFAFLDEEVIDLDLFQVSDELVGLESAPVDLPEVPGRSLSANGRASGSSTFARLAIPTPAANPLFLSRLNPVKDRQKSKSHTQSWLPSGNKKRHAPESQKMGTGRTGQYGGHLAKGNSNSKPGRKPRPSQNRKVVEELVPSLMLRARFSKADLVDGFHNLTVVVTTGDKATRVSESVVFYTSPKAVRRQKDGKSRVTMPARVPFPTEQLAPALRELAAKGAGRVVRIGATPVKSPKVVRMKTQYSTEALEKSRAKITEKLKTKSTKMVELRKVLQPLPKKKISEPRRPK